MFKGTIMRLFNICKKPLKMKDGSILDEMNNLVIMVLNTMLSSFSEQLDDTKWLGEKLYSYMYREPGGNLRTTVLRQISRWYSDQIDKSEKDDWDDLLKFIHTSFPQFPDRTKFHELIHATVYGIITALIIDCEKHMKEKKKSRLLTRKGWLKVMNEQAYTDLDNFIEMHVVRRREKELEDERMKMTLDDDYSESDE